MKASLLERLVSKKKRLKRLQNNIINYLENLPNGVIKDDQRSILSFLKTNNLAVFPYKFPEEYKATDIEIFTDTERNLFYMLWEGKKLYYKKGGGLKKAQEYFNSLRLEQDVRSPHRYLTRNFDVEENDVVVDVGAAEGNFSLSVIERVKHVYLFEMDENWIEALEATFAPWKDKVTVVQKFVSDKTFDNRITLDDFFGDKGAVDFIKGDVEGVEADVLNGALGLIDKQKKLKVAICTYHRQEDAETLNTMLTNLGFKNSFSDGYMIYYYGRSNVVREPFLRRAVLRAVKG